LASHFRLQQFWLTALLALVLMIVEEWRFGVGGMLLAGWLAWPIAPYWDTVPLEPAEGEFAEVKIALINVLVSNEEKMEVRGYLKGVDADVVVLLEVNDEWTRELKLFAESYPNSIVEARDDPMGIWVLSKLPTVGEEVQPALRHEPGGLPSVLVDLDVGGVMPLRLLATHPLPPMGREMAAKRDAQLSWCVDMAVDAKRRPFVLVGDLNVTPFSPKFKRLVEVGGLADHRVGWGEGMTETWLPGDVMMGLSLDHLLTRGGIRVKEWAVGPNVGSDHRPVVVTLEVPL
ncbi:MAG: endonuclease/exonuclease/phosphatase family protein, partial [Verrucomicrobiales bacterium]|nr:endonuclease/exonuclease/phosphatase family protein [Verrucomicrobiales bacterium]